MLRMVRGKSLLSLVLSAVADHSTEYKAIEIVQQRLNRHYAEEANLILQFQQKSQKYLPVILSGDEGSITSALLRALNRSLGILGLGDLRPEPNTNRH